MKTRFLFNEQWKYRSAIQIMLFLEAIQNLGLGSLKEQWVRLVCNQLASFVSI